MRIIKNGKKWGDCKSSKSAQTLKNYLLIDDAINSNINSKIIVKSKKNTKLILKENDDIDIILPDDDEWVKYFMIWYIQLNY